MRLTLPISLASLCATLALGCGLFGKEDDEPPPSPDGGLGETCTRTDDCAGELVCVAGACAVEGSVASGGRCSANRDCVTGLYCGANGLCAPAGGGDEGAACATGGDCLRGFTCVLDGLAGTCQAGGSGDLGATCTKAIDCLAGLACGPAGRCGRVADLYPAFPGITCAPDSAPFRALYEVPRPGHTVADFYRLPFPNDLRVKADGSLDLSDFPHPGPTLLGFDLVGIHADALADDFAGFSSVAPVTFRFSQPIEFASVADGAALFVVDVTDPATASFGANRSRTYDYTSGRGKLVCQNTLTLSNRMYDPLEPGHTYAAWVSSAVRSMTGGAPMQDPDLVAVLAATPPADASLMPAWNLHANFRTYLQRTGKQPTDVATVAVFTVGDASAVTRKLAAQVVSRPLPTLSSLTLCDGAATSPCAGADGRVCGDSSGAFWEIHGKVEVPRYQMGTPPFERPADGGHIQFTDFDDQPIVQATEQVCFALTVPKAAAPATGWPLVVYAHGTGGSFKDAVANGVARELATASRPMATLTLEGVAHGARKGSSSRTSDSLVFNLSNPRAARDNHRQGAVDVLQALRVAQVAPFTVGAAGAIDLDSARTYFFGHSQGANMGIEAVATSDLAPAVVLSGAGSVLVEGLLRKKSPVAAKAGLELLLGEPVGGGHPAMVVWQTFYDPIDPINYAPMLVKRPPAGVASKHVAEVWGKGDTYAPESTMNNTAIAANLVAAEPIVSNIGLSADTRPVTPARLGGDGQQRLAALFQYDGGAAFDGHFVSTRVAAAITDWKAFLTSIAGGSPAVP